MANEFLTGRLGYRKLAEKFGKRLGGESDSFIHRAIGDFFQPIVAEGFATDTQHVLNSKLTPFLHIYVYMRVRKAKRLIA